MPLSDRISPAAKQMVKEAFDDLQNAISTKDRASLEGTTLEDVRQAAFSIEEQLAARQCLRNMQRLTPLFDGLGHYSKTVEVLCNGTPYLPWIWAPIKLILKISSEYIEAFEKIMKAYARISSSLLRFKLFQQTFSNNPLMQDTLAIFYVDIVKFHKEAYKFVRRSGWRILFMTSWGRFERRFDGIVEDLSKHEELIDKTANAVNIHSASAMREDLKIWRQQELRRLYEKEEDCARDQYSRLVGLFKVDNTDQINIFDSILSKATDDAKHCWILTHPKVQAWMRMTDDTALLLLHGHPGTGKSVLATQIATFLRCPGLTQVITHFSTYSSLPSVEYLTVLRSIILQLIHPHTDLVLYAFDELIVKNNKPTASFLEKLIKNIIEVGSSIPSQTKFVHLIFDGLDECGLGVQKRIMSLLERISSTASLPSNTIICKVLVLSRCTSQNSRRTKQNHFVSLSDEKENVNKAILAYCFGRLEAMKCQLVALRISNHDIQTLSNNIVKKADGMFLWSKLVLDYIASNLFFKRHEILSAADYFPTELSMFYDKIFIQLTVRFDEKSVQRLKCILGWIAFAKRPLKRGEFLSALSFGSGDLDEDELPPAHIFDMCAPLIECHQQKFTFVHVSVKDYLQSHGGYFTLDETECLSEQGLAVATCLLSGMKTFQTSYPDASKLERVARGLHGLHIYATEHWVDYLLGLARLEDLEKSLFFCHSREIAFNLKNWATQVDKTTTFGEAKTESLEALKSIRHLSGLLYDVLTAILVSRETNSTNSRLLFPVLEGASASQHTSEPTSLGSLLTQYQRVIKEVLSEPSLPHISFQDLERFKQEFGAMAITCRVWLCPYASTGFNTEAERDEHEVTHQKIMCKEAGCQYPVFNSASALSRHQLKYHNCHLKMQGRIKIKLNNRRTIMPTSGPEDLLPFQSSPSVFDATCGIAAPPKPSNQQLPSAWANSPPSGPPETPLYGNTSWDIFPWRNSPPSGPPQTPLYGNMSRDLFPWGWENSIYSDHFETPLYGNVRGERSPWDFFHKPFPLADNSFVSPGPSQIPTDVDLLFQASRDKYGIDFGKCVTPAMTPSLKDNNDS